LIASSLFVCKATRKSVAFVPSKLPTSTDLTFGNLAIAVLKRSSSPLPAANIKLVSGLDSATL